MLSNYSAMLISVRIGAGRANMTHPAENLSTRAGRSYVSRWRIGPAQAGSQREQERCAETAGAAVILGLYIKTALNPRQCLRPHRPDRRNVSCVRSAAARLITRSGSRAATAVRLKRTPGSVCAARSCFASRCVFPNSATDPAGCMRFILALPYFGGAFPAARRPP